MAATVLQLLFWEAPEDHFNFQESITDGGSYNKRPLVLIVIAVLVMFCNILIQNIS